jgi:hypothetical protein
MAPTSPKTADEVSAEPEQAVQPVEPTTEEVEEEYVPRTELGRELMEIRKRILASGGGLATWEDLEREIAERRGGTYLSDDR